jgi:hypothetical protein
VALAIEAVNVLIFVGMTAGSCGAPTSSSIFWS